jgi:DNA-binding FadR family transcriptional regulator
VQDALPIVVVAVVIVAGVVAIATLVLSRGSYDHIGRSDMTFDRDAGGRESDFFRDEEIRQLLEATNARRAAHGRPPLDLSALQGAPDDELRAEIRAFVESRNARRIARGQPPLDVEAEVERRLSSQDG